MKRGKKIIIAVGIAAGLILTVGFADNNFKIAKSLDIYFNLFKELNFYYVDDIDPEKIVQSSIDGMLETLDPYTTFIPESEMDDFKFQTTGQYGGIGALIRRHGDNIVIAEPYEGFPAQKAGLIAGDILVEIDGNVLKNKDVTGISDMLKGTPGTEVVVKIRRFGTSGTQRITIKRQKITVPNVPYYGFIKDSVGYIRLTSFTSDAGLDVQKALMQLTSQHAKGIVFDLRNNPGGLLNEAINVANNFIDSNQLVVFTKGKVKEVCKDYYTSSNPVDTAIPVVVLVNRGSASASEIVAGSLQDLDRAVILGQRTYGKGLVQQTRPLSYNTQLKVTTAKYYIPSGRCIQALDYSHRNDDGSVGHVPDSLIRAFKTKGGRKVFDGGGVLPDVIITPERLSDMAFNLYAKNFIFDFASLFSSQHNTIADARKFQITDSIYASFTSYLSDKDIAYKTKTEDLLKDLMESAKAEKYYSGAVDEFRALKAKIAHDRNKDMETYRKDISQLLTEEIVTRYYYQKGKIVSSFRDDPEIDKAVAILTDKTVYNAILTGTFKTDSIPSAVEPTDQ